MDYFEGMIKTLLESDGYWVRQSFKVNLTKEEKRNIGKHSGLSGILCEAGLNTI